MRVYGILTLVMALLQREVAYLRLADIVSGPLPSRLRRLTQPVMSPPNRFSTPRSPRLACHLSTREPLHIPILNRHPVLDRLRLGPRWHPVEQHLFERPDVIGQSRRHRRCTRPPHLR